MDADFIGSEVLDEEAFEFQENHDFPLPEVDGERCGICMDIIIDRGVLDCCQHWFCFGCIDDWATITNLCPLCQNVFQSITCVPVYDTIGGSAVDDDSFSGDDDWSIEGTSGTPSMPSYYIDENAVTCLDGDCKVRSGSATIGEDCNLETSIACDSCDTWFHAACVGFDPEGSSEDTWLCPRCSKSDSTSIQRPNGNCVADTLLSTCMNEAALCGNMSVSVADTGETALVVSMIEADRPSESLYTARNTDEDFGLNNGGNFTAETTEQTDLISKGKGSGLSSSNDAFINHCMVQTGSNGTINEGSSSGGSGTSLRRLSMELHEQDDQPGRGPGFGLFPSLFPADHLIDETVQCNDNKEGVGNSGSKRKHVEFRDNSVETVDEGTNSENFGEALKKKIRGSEELQPASSVDQLNAPRPADSLKCLAPVDVKKDLNSKQSSRREDVCDIMSIVKGTGRRPSGKRESRMPGIPAKETENKAGLRVKKIIRRASDDKESAIAVQKLRKEIRDAVRNKSSSDFGEHLFDPELLSAFRTAIAGSTTEPIRSLPHTAIKMKKSLMQKGKVRENLTKKIYADSNGRRKRAWDRDCEVEFWKYRCMRPTKPEKIATLNSVLNLLKKDAEGTEKDVASGSQERNPILSRLYLADTSVFPRKDNIKPLSALETASNSEQNGALASVGESQKSSSDGQGSKSREANKILTKNSIISADDKGIKDKILSSKNSSQSNKAQTEKGFRASQASPLGGPKSNLLKETVTKSGDRKIDKRKWALEVLARKMAVGGKSGEQEKREDNVDLKETFPLLAQLSRDMRPELAPSRHKKIPMSIRQKQLYRLTEHFLKKLNLSEMRRVAETELAVADAINIEKVVADRSNTKQGYLNLCSHEILRRSDGNSSLKDKESSSEAESTKSAVVEQPCEDTVDPDVLDALRNAGLLPDSPPSTPNELPAEADESKVQRGDNNVFEIDANADVDIYGDFEYDLEEEDYIGATSVKVSKQPVEDGESKLKVVLTTLKCDVLIDTENASSTEKFEKMEAPHVPPLQENQSDVGIISSTTEVHATEAMHHEDSEEPSLAECEELYGPDKEPTIDKHPSEIPHRQPDSEVPEENAIHGGNKKLVSGQADGKDVPASHECNGDTAAGRLQVNERVSGSDKPSLDLSKPNDGNSVSKKVEAYIKEHIRPLCKSGIITAEQYRWAVAKTTDKVMKFHSNSKNANFLIKEGDKVKKLAEKYIEAAQQKGDK